MVGMDMRLSTLTTDIDVRQKATAAVGWALSNDSYVHAAALVGAGRPAVIASVDTLLQLPGLVRDLAALNIPVIPTPAASGVIIAADVAGLLLDGARIEIATARHANLTLTDGGAAVRPVRS